MRTGPQVGQSLDVTHPLKTRSRGTLRRLRHGVAGIVGLLSSEVRMSVSLTAGLRPLVGSWE